MSRIAAVALIVIAAFATPAHASRAYGVLDPGTTLLTFAVDDGTVRSAAVRTLVRCDDGDSFAFAANFRIAARPRHDEENLVPLGGLRYRVVADYGRGRDLVRWRGTLSVSRPEARKPRVHFTLRQSDEVSTCTAEITRLARREPGVLYTGGTDDDEPVWLRVRPEGVEWVAGYGVGCGRTGFMEGLHEDLLPLTTATTFGRGGLIGGFEGDRSVDAHGVLGPSEASGIQRVTGSDGGRRCDTKERPWRAVTG
jgi:hypothetical protein